MTARVPRPASRILLLDEAGRVLLFRFTPADRPPFWCLAGGAVDPGESYEQAAARELIEETGLALDYGPEVARRVVQFVTLQGVPVDADERYFLVRTTADAAISAEGHTELERQVLERWRWFDRTEIAAWPEPIYPDDLAAMLEELDP